MVSQAPASSSAADNPHAMAGESQGTRPLRAVAPSWLVWLSAALVGVTYVLLVFGASVRVHGAGLACPDWPLCFGKVVPPIDFQVSLEFGHRVLAGLVSLGYVAVLFGVFRAREALGRGVLAVGALGLGILVVQIILGGLTVLELLAEWTVTSHLLAGNAFCATLFVLALRLRPQPARAPIPGALRIGGGLLMAAVVAQLALGGLVSSSHAGLVCGTWPTCDGTSWFPTFSGLVGLQVSHRLLAYVVAALALGVAAITRGRGRAGVAGALVAGLVLCQVALGVANVLLHLPVEVTLAHTAGAAAIVLATTWLNHELWAAPLAAPRSAVEVPNATLALRDSA